MFNRKPKHKHKGPVVDSVWVTVVDDSFGIKNVTRVTAHCDECLQLVQVELKNKMDIPEGMVISR